MTSDPDIWQHGSPRP